MGIAYVPHYDDNGVDRGGYTETVPDTQPKEEPDCLGCDDAGGPCCGRYDTANPEHRQAIAEQIIRERARMLAWNAPIVNTELDAITLLTPERDARAIDELVRHGEVTISITWPKPGPAPDPWATSAPF